MEKTRKWRWGVNRWFVLAFIVLGIYAARAYSPILPHVQLPAEVLSSAPLFTIPGIGDIYLTNTLLAVLVADFLLIMLAVYFNRRLKKDGLVPRGLASVVEAISEYLYNLTDSTAGAKWTRRIFPIIGTIFMLLLVINWMELIPGVDSIGLIHHVEAPVHGYPIETVGHVGDMDLVTIVKDGGDGHGDPHADDLYHVVPFIRVASTDLNFTVALAIVSVIFIQVFGIWSLGGAYFTKFFNIKSLFTKPIFGVIDFAVSLLELVSEFSKIISFSFRLFGNIFAGSVLLFVIGSLVPVVAQTAFLGLEFIVGAMQALVFGMLTMIFIAQATQGHGHEEGH